MKITAAHEQSCKKSKAVFLDEHTPLQDNSFSLVLYFTLRLDILHNPKYHFFFSFFFFKQEQRAR